MKSTLLVIVALAEAVLGAPPAALTSPFGYHEYPAPGGASGTPRR
jgi:hypothetical protein